MPNAYENIVTGPGSVARGRALVTPSDTRDLPRTAKGLCIDNLSSATATVSIVDGHGETSTISVPAGAKWTEGVIVTRVRATGTTISPAVVIHAYTD